MKFSKTEKEADTIYKLAKLDIIDKELFVYMAISLQKKVRSSSTIPCILNFD